MNRETAGGPGLSLILDAPVAERFRRHLVAAFRQRGFRSLSPGEQPTPPKRVILGRGPDVVTVEVRPGFSGSARIILRVASPEGEAVLTEAAAETAKELVLDVVQPLATTRQGGRLSAEMEDLLRTILGKLDGLRTMSPTGLPATEI